MQVITTKPNSTQTFNGSDVDQRFARKGHDEPIVRGSIMRFPQSADDEDTPPEDDGNQTEEYRKGVRVA